MIEYSDLGAIALGVYALCVYVVLRPYSGWLRTKSCTIVLVGAAGWIIQLPPDPSYRGELFIALLFMPFAIFAMWYLWLERGAIRTSRHDVLGYLAVISWVTLWFVELTEICVRYGATLFSEADPTFWQIAGFYWWHLLDQIPVIDVTTTLRMGDPITYSSTGTGALLLAFKVLVAVPSIGFVIAVGSKIFTGQPQSANESAATADQKARARAAATASK